MVNRLRTALFVSVLILTTVRAAQAGSGLFDALRNDDMPAVRAAVADKQNLEIRRAGEVSPLMYAAAYGSQQSVELLLNAGANPNAKDVSGATALIWAAGDAGKAKLLIAHGADVNAQTASGRTPLMVAAAQDGNLATVRLLLSKGAKVSVADALGATPLILAAGADDLDTVRLLLEHGANPNDTTKGGLTALMNAAENPAMVRLLLSKGADVNAANTFSGKVKFGEIALKQMTPLMLAVPHGGTRVVTPLLEAGANVNAKDSRGMTPLMLAVASDTQNAAVVKRLLDAGADVNARDNSGETALDWAAKYGDPKILSMLRNKGAIRAKAVVRPVNEDVPPADAREAVERSIALIQKSNAEFFRQSACVACHHQGLGIVATEAARKAGVAVDETAAAQTLKSVAAEAEMFAAGMLERHDGPANPDIQVSWLFAFIAANQPASDLTDTVAVNIAAKQQRDGHWQLTGFSRAPFEESNLARTALSLRALQVYGFPGRLAEFRERLVKARRWLETAGVRTTDDKVWRLLGMHWAGSDAKKMKQPIAALLQLQGEDGGWAANPNLRSDVYSTASALYALRTAGVLDPSDRAYQRGVAYLLKTQFEDGSWYMRSRAPKFQPYFESGFPFGEDQWASSAATAWATMALAAAVRPELSRVDDNGRPATGVRRLRAGGGE